MKNFIFIILLFTAKFAYSQALPYPIIFIHGLNSEAETWVDMKSHLENQFLNYGGRINFCLNYDGNNDTANKKVYPEAGADIAYFEEAGGLATGDFYIINFHINNQGIIYPGSDDDLLSNESAIAKQGVALKYAIQIVLSTTGRDKVVLMGHSMGGLAAREYLQNESNWQDDGEHHVSKLITTGTPHRGYTGTNAGLITGINSSSEAYRDLRKEYSNNAPGVYLYGGFENSTIIPDGFFNSDINCNGVSNDGSTIIGLNYKSLSTNVDYAYITGICTNCQLLQGTIPGDGIVRSENANLDFYSLPEPRNKYTYTAAANNPVIGLHSDLPKAVISNMQGLDEPNEYNLSYGIVFDQQYIGFITEQPVDGYPYDYDDFTFSIPEESNRDNHI